MGNPLKATVRILPPEEWPKLVRDGIEPFATYGLPDIALRDNWRMVVAEEDGRIIALSSLRTEVLNDWFIAPSARKSPTLVERLWRETKQVLDDAGVRTIHATAGDPGVQEMLPRLGYFRAPGDLYLLHTADCILNTR